MPIHFQMNCSEAPRDGANIDGLVLEGARWDNLMNSLVNARLKELFFEMPLIHIKAITKDKQELRNVYECPIYRTRYVLYRNGMRASKRKRKRLKKNCSIFEQLFHSIFFIPLSVFSLRGPTYIWTFNLKTREKPSKWILAGVAIVLQP